LLEPFLTSTVSCLSNWPNFTHTLIGPICSTEVLFEEFFSVVSRLAQCRQGKWFFQNQTPTDPMFPNSVPAHIKPV
jgi:hypothetical protein